MSGAPQVSLLRAGLSIGTPAAASSKPAHVVVLARGKSAGTTITGFSTCNAANSDTVRISPPGEKQTVDAPLELRACQLQVDPVATG
jgi:hypothetical protein